MRRYTLEVNGKQFVISVQEETSDSFRVFVGDQAFEVRLESDEDLAMTSITPQIMPPHHYHEGESTNGHSSPFAQLPRPAVLPPATPPPAKQAEPAAPAAPARAAAPAPSGGAGALKAPMPGTILEVNVAAGAKVTRGQQVAVLEAMKMKNVIKSPRDGVVAQVHVAAGQTVGHGQALISYEEGA